MAEFDSEAAFFEKQFNYLKLKQIKTKLYKKTTMGNFFLFAMTLVSCVFTSRLIFFHSVIQFMN